MKSQPDFKAVFEGAPGAYLLLSPQLQIIGVSAVYLNATMTKRDDIVGRHLFDVFPDNPADFDATGVQNLKASLDRVLAFRKSDTMAVQKYDIRKPSGEFEIRYWSPINSPILDEKGEITSIVHRVEDVTEYVLLQAKESEQARINEEQKSHTQELEAEIYLRGQELQQANRELRALNETVLQKLDESEANFRTIIEAIPQLVWMTDAAGQVKYFNNKWFNYTGLKLEDGFEAAIHPESLQQARANWAQAIKTGKPFEADYRLKRFSDQSYRWHLCQAVPVRGSEGNVKRWFGTFTDIDDQKLARIEYEKNVDTSPAVLWITEPDGSCSYLSQQWREVTGQDPATGLGFGWVSSIHPEDRARVEQRFTEANAEQTAFAHEYRLKSKSGEYRWSVAAGNPRFDQARKFQGFAGVFLDIHEQKVLAQELIASKEEAIAASKAKSSFLANISHEIRTPLGVIRGFSDLLMDGQVSLEDKKNWISTIRKNAYHLSDLVDELLDLSKIESQRIEVEKIKFSIHELLDDVKNLLSHKADLKGLSLKFLSEVAMPKRIESDPTRLKQILVNLIGNAIKFTDRGGVIVESRLIPIVRGEAQLEISVRDSGIGMNIEQQRRLFQRFMQADSSTTRKYGGSGLGLYVSKNLAQSLGGDLVLAESTAGSGSTFVLTIKCGDLSEEDFQARPDIRNKKSSLASPQQLKGIKVLLVEDAPDNQVLISRILTLAGATVEVAENGLQAVLKAQSSMCDVVLMDIQMPVLDGFGATKQLREKGFDKPIIALTAHAMKQDREHCLQSGFNEHLSKPIDREKLIDVILRYAVPNPPET